MDEKYTEPMPHRCLWHDQCQCVETCEYYTPMDDDEMSDEELENKKTEFRHDFFKYAEEHDVYED